MAWTDLTGSGGARMSDFADHKIVRRLRYSRVVRKDFEFQSFFFNFSSNLSVVV